MKYWVIFFVFISSFKSYPQQRLLEHPHALAIVKKGLFHIYNAETHEAVGYIEQVEQLMPKHPVGPMMRALNTNWSSNPLEIDSKEFNQLNGHLQLSLDLTKKMLQDDPKHMEGVFFAMAINSWLAQFYDEDGSTFKALNAAKRAYHFMKLGFELMDQSPEFYFSTGLYNYYRVQYPESNPVYKPFMWFFRSGDKQLGLEQLEEASKIATFTKAEAAMYLAHLNLRYEQKPKVAVKFSGQLVKQYPNNIFFKINFTEALLAAGYYQQAYTIIQNLLQQKKTFYRMSGEIFYGLYLEQFEKNPGKALIWYTKSLDTGKDLGPRADNKKSLAHVGIARINHAGGDHHQARDHYKQALKLAQYDTIKDQAKAYLRNN
ncbi:MAG: tetratricopeptide repeat protein [Cyclobacteriaceae bacterium]|nr:tetratricopeptide repeat protein [Cyclobacteriaceae bacterium]